MYSKDKFDWPVILISGGFLVLFVLASLINADYVGQLVSTLFSYSADYFGLFWQVLMLATFLVAIGIAVSKYGRITLGKREKPEMSTFKWIAIIMCTLLAGGGVFWAPQNLCITLLQHPLCIRKLNPVHKRLSSLPCPSLLCIGDFSPGLFSVHLAPSLLCMPTIIKVCR